MKKILAPLVWLMALASCGQSTYPIDEPARVPVNPVFLGRWASDHKDDVYRYYTITKADATHYKVDAAYTAKHRKQAHDYYTAFLSDVNQVQFLNVRNSDSTNDSGYMFMRVLEADPSHIKLAVVNDTTMQYLKSVADVRQYVSDRRNDPLFYNDTVMLIKNNKK
jgi:hypothetical protein